MNDCSTNVKVEVYSEKTRILFYCFTIADSIKDKILHIITMSEIGFY
jgi:hypothetical protein